jgi:4-amino-4-deoxy-L-arabinose transferase-like glycosyltransferase
MPHLGPAYFFWMMIARWSCIPFSCVGAWVCYAWASDLYGTNAGLVALMLWCTSPLVLAFGGALIPDVPSGATGILALYWYWKWTKEPSVGNAYMAGLGIGLAELTKSTWILLHPALFLLTACLCVARSDRNSFLFRACFSSA